MATPTVSNSYSSQNLSTVTSNMTSTPINNSAIYYNLPQTSVTINSGISVYGGGGMGGSMQSNTNAMSRVGVPGNNGQHGIVNQTTITTLTNYGSLVGGGGGGGQGTNYGGGGYTPGWNGGNGAAGGGGGGGGAGGPAGGGWGTGSSSNNGNPGTSSSGGKGGGDGQTDAGGSGGGPYGSPPAQNATANCSNGAGGGGCGGQAGGTAGTQYAIYENSIVQNSSLTTITSNAGSYYYGVGGTNVYGGGGGSGGYGIVNDGTITTLVNSQPNLYLYNLKANGITNYNFSVSSTGVAGVLNYYGAANSFTFNLDPTNIANYKKQTYSGIIQTGTGYGGITFNPSTGSVTSNGTTVNWTLSASGSTYNLVINSITSSSSTKTTASSKVSTKGSTGAGPTPSGGTGSGPAPTPTPTSTPTSTPKQYILSLSNSMTIWSGTNPSNVTQFIWNPTGGITQSNSNSGIADLQPNPTYQSSAGKTTNTWISSGFTLAKGDFIGNSDGSLYLIMNTDGNLNLCTTSYSYYSGVEIPGGRYAGSTGQNAIYQFNEVGKSALINNIYYIDGDTNAYKYPSDYISQGINYTQFSNIDACGNDLGPTNNSSVSQCEQICDANNNCYGFVLDSNSTCRPKNKNMWPYNNNQIPSQGTNTYLKMNKLIQTPLGVSYNTTNTNSYVAKSYPQATGGIQNAYGLAIYIMSELDKLRILEQNINSMAKEISNYNINIDNNQIKILNQANKDKEAIELFIEDYKKIEEGIKKVDNQEYLLVDTDIKLLQENYNYYLWTILAIGIVIVGINVMKKKPFF